MFDDFKDLLSIFNAQAVRYLVVGGYAVSFHAQPRATKDIDLLIQPYPENTEAVCMALTLFGAPMTGITPSTFSDQRKFFRMGREPIAVDILPEIDGVDFDQAWERRVEVVIDTKTGLTAHFISAPDLIASKLAAGRPQDLADVTALQTTAGLRAL